MGRRAHTPTISEPPSGDRNQRAPDPASAALLRLQNTAGNAAVTQLIGQRRLARKRQVPANPTTLSDYSDVRGEISFDTATGKPVADKDVPGLFKKGGARFEPRAGFDVSLHFSSNIAQDRDRQDLIETGLAGGGRAPKNQNNNHQQTGNNG